MSNRDRRQFDSILREPLTRQRLMLNSKIRAAQQGGENATPFTLDDLKGFLAGLQTLNRGRPVDPVLAAEINNATAAVETGVPQQPPKFETPETQLVWGAAIAYLSLNPQSTEAWKTPVPAGELRSSDLWKQITGTRRAYQELLSHAHHVREALRDKDTKYGWSDPGQGFTFARQKNIINIDLMQSMIVGFEHARADVYREIGNALLSVGYPKRMQQVYAEMQPLMRKMQQAQAKKGPQLKDEEYKQLRILSAEWQLRHMMFSSAEENTTSRFVANMAAQMLQDYSVSMNNTAVTFRGVGLTRLPQGDQISDELRRYMNLCNTVQLSFYQNNGMFDNTDSGWSKVGIDANLVRKTATLAGRPSKQKNDTDGISHADFQYLRQLCGGPNGLENLQPKQHERLYGWSNLQNRIARSAGERNAIIEQIWQLYAEDLIQQILQHTQEQVEQEMKEAKEKQQDQDQDGQDQDGQDQDGQDGDDGQDGQDAQDGQDGQGQGQGKGKGKPQKGQKPQKNQKQRNKPQGDQMDPDDMDDADGQDGQKGDKKDQKDKSKSDKQKGEKGDKSDKADGDEQDGQDGDGQDQDGDQQDGQKGEKGDDKNSRDGELGADEKDTVPVEGMGDMPAPDAPFEDPSDETDPEAGNEADGEGQDGEGQDADGQDGDGEDGDAMTQDELEQNLQDMEDAEAEEGDDADGQDQDGEGDGQQPGQAKKKMNKPSKQAGHSEGKKLGDLSQQDWTQYQQRINELSGPINRVRKLFKQVQERQVQRKPVQSPKLDILPENGEVKDRFNAEAHRNLIMKKATGQMTADDLKRFHTDETKLTPTQVDVVLLIDGSGSMKGVPLNSALQASAIMFEAAAGRDMNINVYVVIWGDSNPPVIIRPGADRVKVGQAMQAARQGLNSGTDFAPAVKKVAETIAEERGKSGVLSGFTHAIILSDGDIFDEAKSREMINTMFTYSDKVTFDTAIIGRPGTNMEKMSKSIKGHKPFQQVGVTLGNDPNEIPMNIVGLLLEKIRKCGSFNAVPTSQKRRQMQKAHNKMDPKR